MELPNKGLDSVISKLNQAEGRKEGRVKLGLCASLLALSSIDGWVSCNEEVP